MAMFSPEQIAEFERRSEQVREKISPPGALGLPALLDERRIAWGITDGAFAIQAAFDKVLIYQIPPRHFEKGTWGAGSKILMPDAARDAQARTAPRGIIVSAGLKALDELVTNGMQVGDIVCFNHVAPWRVETDVIGGKVVPLLVMHTGHLVGSEDTARRLRDRQLGLSVEKVENTQTFVYRDKNGRALIPLAPTMDGEF